MEKNDFHEVSLRRFSDYYGCEKAPRIGTKMSGMIQFTLPKLRPDLIQAAFPTNQPRPRWAPRSEADSLSTAIRSLKMSDPLYYNSLVDKHTKRHLTRPSVKIHFEKCGFIAKDGTVYPTRREQIEANRANRLLEEKEAILLKVEERERARMERLRKMARAGDVVFTKEGIVEAKPCSLCHSYHKIASLLSPPEPCPGSQLAKYATLDPLPATYRSKTSRKVSSLPVYHYSVYTRKVQSSLCQAKQYNQ